MKSVNHILMVSVLDSFRVFRTLGLLMVFTILFLPAEGQKKKYRQVYSLESAGQLELAAEKYREILYRNATHSDALGGLERTSQKLLDQKLSDYFIARNSGETAKALGLFEEALEYRKELDYFNIQLEIPSYYFSDYEEDKKKANQELTLENKTALAEQLEQQYQEAKSLYDQGKWVASWQLFQKVKGHGDSKLFIREIESRAQRLSLVPNIKNQFSNEEILRNALLAEIFQLNNPLIKVINRENLDQVVEEQKLGLSGLLDEQSAAELGKIVGVELMLITRMLNYQWNEGDQISQNKTAYSVSISQNTKNYSPVTYQTHRQENYLEASFQYQLIDVATAEILDTEIIYEKITDETKYATYMGDYHALYPSDGTHIFKKGIERDQFLKLFEARQENLGKKSLEVQMQKSLAKKIAKSLDLFFRS